MTELETDDAFTELAQEERRRRHRRLVPASMIRLLLVLAGIVVVAVVVGLVVRNWVNDREAASYRDYMVQVAAVLERSDAIGAELSLLLTKPGDSTRKDVQTKLDKFIQEADKLDAGAKELEVPGDLREAHQWFVATLQLRDRGLQNLKPSLMNALEVQDIEVASDQITRAMQLLLLSDVAYDEFFVSRAAETLKQKNLEGVTVPGTDFLTDANLASKPKVKEILTTLKSSGNLQAVHGVAITKVVALPSEKAISAGNTYNLPSSDQLAFKVTVENQGNMSEKDVPVTLTLTSPESTQPQIITVKITEIKPKEQFTVSVKGVNPTAYGEKALLRVEAGPVKGEKVKDNNVLESHVIFIL